ncbi:MAG TPA: hypothetical protein VKA07_00385 [Candidatus Sulfotelmatobacter sp.]|nr:hypothetical protein [Candidatus Sulfotelmatobacter sp.]
MFSDLLQLIINTGLLRAYFLREPKSNTLVVVTVHVSTTAIIERRLMPL